MTDILVTLPQSFGMDAWVTEGDLPGDPWSGNASYFFLGGPVPNIKLGERVYICYRGLLRGYAPLVRIDRTGPTRYALVRHGGAVAVTIDREMPGFRGFRYRWWERQEERPFPEWRTAGIAEVKTGLFAEKEIRP